MAHHFKVERPFVQTKLFPSMSGEYVYYLAVGNDEYLHGPYKVHWDNKNFYLIGPHGAMILAPKDVQYWHDHNPAARVMSNE